MINYEQIDNYLQGKLEGQELEQFEQRLGTDAAFAETVALYRSIDHEMNTGPEEQALKEKLSLLNKKYFTPSGPAKIIPIGNAKRTWSIVAAAAAAAIFIILISIPSSKTPERLFAEITAGNELPVSVRGNEDSLKQAIAKAYNNRDYIIALPLLEQYTKDRPGDAAYNCAKALSYIETGNTAAATGLLDTLAKGSSVYKYKAVAAQARIFFIQDKIPEAVALLEKIPQGASEYKKAQELIGQLQ